MNSFGECALQYLSGPPMQITGKGPSNLSKQYMGPVPAEDTLIMALPKISLATSSTRVTTRATAPPSAPAVGRTRF